MTLDLSDIEDITNPQSRDPYPTTSPTVRIRKLPRKKLHDSPTTDCEGSKSSCGGDCSCANGGGLTELFNEHERGDRKYSNSVSYEDDEPEQAPAELPQYSNDINPSSHTIYLKTWGCSHNNSDSEYMAGLLAAQGYKITTTNYTSASLIILNSCTVKGPSEQHFKNEITRATSEKKHVVLAGCVPQSDKSYRKVASVIGVQQIDRIVEVVEETLKGNKLSYVRAKRSSEGKKSPGADLGLPKIRKNELIEIVPISSGCLNNCTYCKTKQARGMLVSYRIESITSRISHVCTHENVKEIWLTSEDLGAWGIDLGMTIVDLLNAIVQVLPGDVMLRLGMTNPPYILDHLEEISKILSHPNVYEFLHIPVQSGSDSVLLEMKREYTRKEFERICDFMIERVPGITLATDLICGYPTETEEDFQDSYDLVEKYKFPVLFINQFYPRPGTVAAKLKRVNTEVVKGRTRRVNELFQGYQGIGGGVVGGVQRVLVTEVAHDGVKYVGHNKQYQQVLVDKDLVVGGTDPMGKWVDVEVDSVTKFSMIGGKAVVVGEGGSISGKLGGNVYLLCILLVVVVCLVLMIVM